MRSEEEPPPANWLVSRRHEKPRGGGNTITRTRTVIEKLSFWMGTLRGGSMRSRDTLLNKGKEERVPRGLRKKKGNCTRETEKKVLELRRKSDKFGTQGVPLPYLKTSKKQRTAAGSGRNPSGSKD